MERIAARLFIADDHEPTRALLRALLGFVPNVELVGEAADGEAAVRGAVELAADIVLLDVNMPRLDGIAAAELIRSYRPQARVILHTAEPEDVIAHRIAKLDLPLVSKEQTEEAVSVVSRLAELLDHEDGSDSIEGVVLSALIGRSADSVSVYDANLQMLFSNQSADELYEGRTAPRGEAFEESVRNFRLVNADGSERAPETLPLIRCAAERIPIADEVSELRDGTIRTYAITAVPSLDSDGGLLGVALYSSLAE